MTDKRKQLKVCLCCRHTFVPTYSDMVPLCNDCGKPIEEKKVTCRWCGEENVNSNEPCPVFTPKEPSRGNKNNDPSTCSDPDCSEHLPRKRGHCLPERAFHEYREIQRSGGQGFYCIYCLTHKVYDPRTE